MAEAYLIRRGDGSFLPADSSDQELLKKFKIGDAIKFRFSKPRNYENHKRFFALLNLTAQNLPEHLPDRFENIKHLKDEIMIGIGHCEWRESLGGQKYPIPKSIAFSSIDEIEFNRLYSLASNYILKWFLPDLSQDDLNENLNLFI
jgi:hypothetical protein